jgi:hypothetical protein
MVSTRDPVVTRNAVDALLADMAKGGSVVWTRNRTDIGGFSTQRPDSSRVAVSAYLVGCCKGTSYYARVFDAADRTIAWDKDYPEYGPIRRLYKAAERQVRGREAEARNRDVARGNPGVS